MKKSARLLLCFICALLIAMPLAEHFIRGAKEAGHKVTVFDDARANLH